MKDFRNFILISNETSIITATYANCSSEVTYKKFIKDYPQTKISATNIDALKILNKHMAQILQWKDSKEAISLYYLLVPPKLCKVIKDKTYKVWLDPGERQFNVPEEELRQWRIFDMLYRKVYADISIKPNNIYNSKNINKAYRHITYTKEVINKMYVYLDKDKAKTSIKTVSDLLK